MSTQQDTQWLDELFVPFYCSKMDCAEGRRIVFDDENVGEDRGECPCNVPIRLAKQAILSKMQEVEQYQTHIYYQEKSNFWGVRIAHEGRQIYGDVFRTEIEARNALEDQLAALQPTEEEG